MDLLDFISLSYFGVPSRPAAVPLASTDTWDEVLNYASGGVYASMKFSTQASGDFKSAWVTVAKQYANVYKEATKFVDEANREISDFVTMLHSADASAHDLRERERGSKPQLPVLSADNPPVGAPPSPGLSTVAYMSVAGIPLWTLGLVVVGAFVTKKYILKKEKA